MEYYDKKHAASSPRPPLIILTGPTAAGKTSLSIALARAIGGEIISADSIQVYRGLDIGSAKIRPEEMCGVPHHLIDVLDPRENFDVVRFQKMAKEAMRTVYQKGHIPVLTGGTGFYIQSVLYDIDFSESRGGGPEREMLEAEAEKAGAATLHERLRKVDPESADAIHPNNVRRVIRALEYYQQTGQKISEHNRRQRSRVTPYNAVYFVLHEDREKLYRKIDQRVDQMMEAGLVREVEKLKAQGCTAGMTSMQGLGYKEILAFLDGSLTLEEAVYTLKRDTRHFAKRQLTWFKRERNVIWLDKASFENDEELLLEQMLTCCRMQHIIETDGSVIGGE